MPHPNSRPALAVAREGATARLVVDGIAKGFLNRGEHRRLQRLPVLEDVSFESPAGQFLSILGPSGSGKTTLLKIVAGLLAPDAGRVLVNGKPIRGPARDRGFVFQNFNLIPWRSVLGNIVFGLELRGTTRDEARSRALDYVKLVGLEGFERHYPHQLSGGMQQRVGIARALVMAPDILLMDEPFAALDAYTREEMQVELLRILQGTRQLALFVTHSIDEAVYLSDRVLLLSPRPSRIVDDVTIDLPRRRTEAVRADARFVEYAASIRHQFKVMTGGRRVDH